MADYTLADALDQTRTNLLAIAMLAIDDVAAAYDYASARPNTANIFELLLTDYSEALPTQDTQKYTFGAELRLLVDSWMAGYDGQTQVRAAWQYLPTAAQYFVTHRGLNAVGTAGARPPYLDPANTHVTRARVMTLPSADSADGGKIVVSFTWQLVYLTAMKRCGL